MIPDSRSAGPVRALNFRAFDDQSDTRIKISPLDHIDKPAVFQFHPGLIAGLVIRYEFGLRIIHGPSSFFKRPLNNIPFAPSLRQAQISFFKYSKIFAFLDLEIEISNSVMNSALLCLLAQEGLFYLRLLE